MLHVSSKLLAPKDFTLGNKVEELFSHNSLDQFSKAACKVEITRLEGDFCFLSVLQYFSQFHLHIVNVFNTTAKYVLMHLGLSAFWSTLT